jgi:NADP-dependent 3-hydroxy acid dehydrogenase YdfG
VQNNSKAAIVTGASSGLGYATSLALSKDGIRVAVGARRLDRLHELEEQIVKNGNEGKIGVVEDHTATKEEQPIA